MITSIGTAGCCRVYSIWPAMPFRLVPFLATTNVFHWTPCAVRSQNFAWSAATVIHQQASAVRYAVCKQISSFDVTTLGPDSVPLPIYQRPNTSKSEFAHTCQATVCIAVSLTSSSEYQDWTSELNRFLSLRRVILFIIWAWTGLTVLAQSLYLPPMPR